MVAATTDSPVAQVNGPCTGPAWLMGSTEARRCRRASKGCGNDAR
jgi:hypothetical protein